MDIRQALNILAVATDKQLVEVKKFIEEESKLFKDEAGKELMRRIISLIAYVGCLFD